MSIRAVFFDLGGVILRTEYQAPREYLAERLNLSYEELSQAVFESPSARRASLGEIGVDEHWAAVAARLRVPPDEVSTLREDFFGGDVIDRELIDLIRGLRPRCRTGLISNGWGDLREYVMAHRFADAFDVLVISAEVGLLKPDPGIYRLALEKAGVEPDSALFIDDSGVNVEAARALGMQAIQFLEPDQLRRDLKWQLD